VGETAKQVWALASVAIALAVAFGLAYALYDGLLLFPSAWGMAGNLFVAIAVGIATFACTAIVLYKGIHPY